MKKLTSGLIVCIHNKREALIAEKAGAQALFYESTGDWKTDIDFLKNIKKATKLPLIHQIHTGHTVEARIFSHLKIDILDESRPFGNHHVKKNLYKSEFMAESEDFWEAMDMIKNGHHYLRTKLYDDHDIADTVNQLQKIHTEIEKIQSMKQEELVMLAQERDIRLEILQDIKSNHFLPVRYFAVVGNISVPDANLMKEYGADGLLIEHDVFDEETDPLQKLKKIREAFEARSVMKIIELIQK